MSTFEHAKLQIDREFCFKTEPVEFLKTDVSFYWF